MIKEAWDALKAAVLLDSELKRQREDILRALNIIRELAAENAELRTRVAQLEQARISAEAQLRDHLLTSLRPSRRAFDFTQHY
ncbi:MAG TPA: hypothetical protein VFD58_32015 [Blastocatellia bacterium]|nr:hypothetical protein [Blastocatellia bacterium]